MLFHKVTSSVFTVLGSTTRLFSSLVSSTFDPCSWPWRLNLTTVMSTLTMVTYFLMKATMWKQLSCEFNVCSGSNCEENGVYCTADFLLAVLKRQLDMSRSTPRFSTTWPPHTLDWVSLRKHTTHSHSAEAHVLALSPQVGILRLRSGFWSQFA